MCLFIRIIFEISYFDWNYIGTDDDLYSLHLSLSLFWIILCIVHKIYIPSLKYYSTLRPSP